MITIAILYSERLVDTAGPAVIECLSCWLELTDGKQTFYLPATAPGDTPELEKYFQTQAEELWEIAKKKRYTDFYAVLPERVLLRAFSELLRQEVNAWRQEAGLEEYAEGEWERKIRDIIDIS